jgi:hypothetical protein
MSPAQGNTIDEKIKDCKDKLQLIRNSIRNDGYNYLFDNHSIEVYEDELAELLNEKAKQEKEDKNKEE